MATKDRYDNNLRRGSRVKDLAGDAGEGEVVGTDGRFALVKWDSDGEETRVPGSTLILTSRTLR